MKISGEVSSFLPSGPPSSDSSSSGSLKNVERDLDMANSKLKKAMEHIMALEEKLQNSSNENATLKVTQKEDEKLWKGLDSKFTSPKTFYDQLTETLKLLACQVQDGAKDKQLLENKMQDLLQKISALEIEKRDDADKYAEDLYQNIERIETLQLEKRDQNAESLAKLIVQLNSTLEEKEQIILQCHEREKNMENRINENHELLVSTENRLREAKKQYDMMLEESSRHLKEASLRSDQAINEMRNKYECEKLDIVKTVKEKADKLIEVMESKWEQRFAECREEARQQLLHTQEEHAAQVLKMQHEYDRRKTSFKACYSEEIKRIILQSESELREAFFQRAVQLSDEHEVQMEAMQIQHEEALQHQHEDLNSMIHELTEITWKSFRKISSLQGR